MSDWESALDTGRVVRACFLDVAKAFDRVDPGLLINKLYGLGISGKELEWLRSYLHDRKISTVVDHVHSSVKVVTSGVPQGSVLGALLFVLYFRDLPSVISAKCVMFADDTLVYDTACCPEKASSCCRLGFRRSFCSRRMGR